MDKTSNKYWVFCIYLALAFVTLAVYWQVSSHDFVDYDDNDYVAQNPQVIGGFIGLKKFLA